MRRKVGDYVMEDLIGRGQFGEVYRGYHQTTKQEVAIKSMPRSKFVGKVKELFESEQKVLKTCKNSNIIKLIETKKTEKNIYMILEYCNEGDLKNYLKKKGKLAESEAVDILIQILNGYKTLVKHNIMHRDLKPANILMHNGVIKIADFGFCKWLDESGKTGTILGSPLNMAPEVLLAEKDNKSYTSAADIWSIGTIIYELLFGTPIYNIPVPDVKTLTALVETYPEIKIPKPGYKISKVVEDVLKRMLTYDPAKRITWEELFGHSINTYREEKTLKELNTSLNNSTDKTILENMSKFYIRTNQVVNNLRDYNKKSQINNYVKKAAKGEADKTAGYNGPIIQNTEENTDQEEEYGGEEEKKADDSLKSSTIEINEIEADKNGNVIAALELRTKIIQRNSNRTLHERNKCAFLGSTADEASTLELKLSNHASFVLLKKLNYMISNLKRTLQKGDKLFLKLYSIEQWETWMQSKEYANILKHLSEEEEVFRGYLKAILEKSQEGDSSSIDLIPGFKEILNLDLNEEKKGNFEEMFIKVLSMYLGAVVNEAKSERKRDEEELRFMWQHADNVLNSLQLEAAFAFENKKGEQFDFTKFYEEIEQIDLETLTAKVNQKLAKLKAF